MVLWCTKMFLHVFQTCKKSSYVLEDKSSYFDLCGDKYVKVKINVCWHEKKSSRGSFVAIFMSIVFSIYFGNASD